MVCHDAVEVVVEGRRFPAEHFRDEPGDGTVRVVFGLCRKVGYEAEEKDEERKN